MYTSDDRLKSQQSLRAQQLTMKTFIFYAITLAVLCALAWSGYHWTAKPPPLANVSEGAQVIATSKRITPAKQQISEAQSPSIVSDHTRTQEIGYFNSQNLEVLLEKLKNDPSNKAEFNLVKAKATEECSAFVKMPNYAFDLIRGRENTGKANKILLEKYANYLTQRCRDFANSEQPTIANLNALYQAAAQQGSAEALAYQLKRELLQSSAGMSNDELRATAVDVINSLDPAAIFELSDAFGTNSKFAGPAVGTEKASAAWQLVACDMGLDCSAGSAILMQFCLNGGVYCDGGNLRQNMQNSGFSPTDFQEIISLETLIYKKIMNGNASSLFN
jgi:hypothetical protein